MNLGPKITGSEDERIRTRICACHIVPIRIRSAPNRGLDRANPVQMYLNVSEGETRSFHRKLSNRDHIVSKRNKSYQKVSARVTSY